MVAPQLRPIQEEDWLLPDTEADVWLDDKRKLIIERRDEVFAMTDAGETPSEEAADLVAKVTGRNGLDAETALEAAAASVSDDLCILVPSEDGFVLGAASLCAPTYWSLTENIGKTLGGLHSPVPGGDPELAGRISRVFSGLKPGKCLERFNWTVQLDGERFTPSSAPMKRELAGLLPQEAAKRLYLRVERQTIRKLPESGGVLFTIRICVDPLAPLLSDSGMCASFADSWQTTSKSLAAYKGWPHYESAVGHLLSID